MVKFLKDLWMMSTRAMRSLNRSTGDRMYWSGVFGMAGVACLAVAFIEMKLLALTSGLVFCYYGLKHKRSAEE